MNARKLGLKSKRSWLTLPAFLYATLGVICSLTSAYTQEAWALPSTQEGVFRGARWALDGGSKVEHQGVTLKNQAFLGLDIFSDVHFAGRHRGDLVAQVYLFDQRSWTSSAMGNTSTAKFMYAPCVIAPNLILLPQGALNVKVGHIWHGYGLRNEINTTQTLRQLISGENTGLLLDWGAELYGEQDLVSYSVSAGSGSGRSLSFEGGTYMSTARLALNADHPALAYLPLKVGLSALSAQIKGEQGFIERWRAGLDVRYQGELSFLFEGSIGADRDVTSEASSPPQREAVSLFAELSWRSPFERWLLYAQQRYLSLERAVFEMDSEALLLTERQEGTTLGVLYTPVSSLSLASELMIKENTHDNVFRFQARYRW